MKTPTISDYPGACGYIARNATLYRAAAKARLERRERRLQRLEEIRRDAFDIESGTCTVVLCLVLLVLVNVLIRVWEASL